MKTAADRIKNRVKRHSRGHFFIIDDFSDISSRDNAKVVLNDLVASGILQRVYHGIYQKPKINQTLNLPVPPKTNEMVIQIGRKNHARVIPAGDTALNMLGVSTQVPATLEYITDGPSRKIEFAGHSKVILRHVSTKKIYADDMTTFVFEVINRLDSTRISPFKYRRIAKVLDKNRYVQLYKDSKKASKKIQVTIEKLGDYVDN